MVLKHPISPDNSGRTATLSRRYELQTVGPTANTVRVSIPRYIVEEWANILGVTYEEFVSSYDVRWKYGNGFQVVGILAPKQ